MGLYFIVPVEAVPDHWDICSEIASFYSISLFL